MSTATKATETNKFGFPIVTCYRCGGTGRYSYNQMDGDRCYGCAGAGKCVRRGKAAKAWAEFVAAWRRSGEVILRDAVAGDVVRWNLAKGSPFVTIASIEQMDRACGWSTVNGVQTAEWFYVRITTDTGEVIETGGNSMAQRRTPKRPDPADYLARI